MEREVHLRVRVLNKRMNEPVFSATEPMSLSFAYYIDFTFLARSPTLGLDVRAEFLVSKLRVYLNIGTVEPV